MSLQTLENAIADVVITRANVEALLDAGKIEGAMANGRWWKVRRNGKTQRWKKDAERIRIPIKVGFYASGTGEITEVLFNLDGVLNPTLFRYAVD